MKLGSKTLLMGYTLVSYSMQQRQKSLKSCLPISDRVDVDKLVAKRLNQGIIQVYALTSDCEDVEIEKLYEEIEKPKGYLKSQDVLIIMGDFNAKVGHERVEDVVGPIGIETVNERGTRLIEWCLINDLHPHSKTIAKRRKDIQITAGNRL
ncbi:craniofacial development protein 2-like [Plakobranchus ocellatus]|uniref:Craniofacial development protein 2-like n=1 Tax=Plakobranchus ocellatus TaxID=259542 RepID=A0AAV4AEH8_9GAST|nr:craniofacial development protein 2-like [Plakobranchus ocellatus]